MRRSAVAFVASSAWLAASAAGCGTAPAASGEIDPSDVADAIDSTDVSDTRDVGATDAATEVTEADVGPLPVPLELYVREPELGCARAEPVDDARLWLQAGAPGDSLAVGAAFYADECTGAGGQHILMRGDQDYWMGAHACYFFAPERLGAEAFAVVRYTQTAAMFSIEPTVCVSFPDDPNPVQSSAIAEAVVLFNTRADAERFAESLTP